MKTYDELQVELRARLHHVASHGEELAKQVQQWVADGHFTLKPEIATDRLSWHLQLHLAEEPPFEKWGLIFGDAVGGLRSVLNNLAWGISQVEAIALAKPKRLQFPIAETRSDWNKNQAKWIEELPVRVRVAIERIQPFQRSGPDGTPQSDALLLLQRLSNTDKHEIALQPIINPVELAHSFAVEFRTEADAAAEGAPRVEVDASFADGTALIRQVTTHPIVKVRGSCDLHAQAVVTDPVAGVVGVTSGLASLLTYVDQICGYVLTQSRESNT